MAAIDLSLLRNVTGRKNVARKSISMTLRLVFSGIDGGFNTQLWVIHTKNPDGEGHRDRFFSVARRGVANEPLD